MVQRKIEPFTASGCPAGIRAGSDARGAPEIGEGHPLRLLLDSDQRHQRGRGADRRGPGIPQANREARDQSADHEHVGHGHEMWRHPNVPEGREQPHVRAADQVETKVTEQHAHQGGEPQPCEVRLAQEHAQAQRDGGRDNRRRQNGVRTRFVELEVSIPARARNGQITIRRQGADRDGELGARAEPPSAIEPAEQHAAQSVREDIHA